MAIKHQVRNRDLEILIEDLKVHMTSYDKQHNPVLPKSTGASDCDFDKLLKIEKFITSVLMNRRDMFERGLVSALSKDFEKLGIPILDTEPLYAVLKERPETFSILLQTLFETFDKCIEGMFDGSSSYARRFKRIADAKVISLANYKDEEKDALNQFVVLFRERVKSEEVKKKLNADKTKAAKRYLAAQAHLDHLFQKHDRLTFICLDLVFLRTGEVKWIEGLPFPQEVDADAAQKFFSKLIRNGKNHQSMRDMAGYFQKWEYNRDKRFYSRCIFAYPSEQVTEIDTLIESLHNYWNDNITGNKGVAHNAKLSKEKELHKTYCTITSHEKTKIELFKTRVLLYMTHIDLYYKPRRLNDFSQLFNRSESKIRIPTNSEANK